MSDTARDASEQSLGQLVAGVTERLSAVARLELELAQAEIKQQLKRGAAGGGMAAVAVFLAFVAFLMLSVAAGLGLATWMPGWAAFLVVAGAYLLLAGVLAFVGGKQFQKVKGPQRAKAQLEETRALLTERSQQRGTP